MGRPSDFANSLKFYKKIRDRMGITNVIQEFKSTTRHDYRHWVYLKGGELACSCECFRETGGCWHVSEVREQLDIARQQISPSADREARLSRSTPANRYVAAGR